MLPLSHHEIMGRVAPFARSGRSVDLSACDRQQRRLALKPVEHAVDSAAAGLPEHREHLQLELPSSEGVGLARTLALPCGLQAKLVAKGAEAGLLLAAVLAVPPSRQLQRVAGHWVAWSHRLVAATGTLVPRRSSRAAAPARTRAPMARSPRGCASSAGIARATWFLARRTA